MPRIIKTGHGVTSEKHVRFNLLTEGEALLRVQRTTKDELDDLERWAKAELRRLGLPAEPGLYRRDGDHWMRLEKGVIGDWRSLDRIIEDDFADHETAHLAARIVREIPALRSALASPDKPVAEAARIAFRLGQWHERARFSAAWGRDAVHGAKLEPVRRALNARNLRKRREIEALKEQCRGEAERLRGQSTPDIVGRLAKTYGKSPRTIYRWFEK